jgi:hypothetical protein
MVLAPVHSFTAPRWFCRRTETIPMKRGASIAETPIGGLTGTSQTPDLLTYCLVEMSGPDRIGCASGRRAFQICREKTVARLCLAEKHRTGIPAHPGKVHPQDFAAIRHLGQKPWTRRSVSWSETPRFVEIVSNARSHGRLCWGCVARDRRRGRRRGPKRSGDPHGVRGRRCFSHISSFGAQGPARETSLRHLLTTMAMEVGCAPEPKRPSELPRTVTRPFSRAWRECRYSPGRSPSTYEGPRPHHVG